jgi:hypothetical protein
MVESIRHPSGPAAIEPCRNYHFPDSRTRNHAALLSIIMFMRLTLAAILSLAVHGHCVAGQDATESPRVDHCIIIAVDGLRSDALMVSPRDLPAFRRLMDEGASTLNARTDPDITVTLPNHLGMVTGRLMLGDEGHHWERNDLDDENAPQILHDARGQYIQSIFDVAHDHGLRVSIIAGKTKLHLLNNSWGDERGLEDVIGDDDGRTKIDTYVYDEAIDAIATKIIETLTAQSPSLPGSGQGGGSGAQLPSGVEGAHDQSEPQPEATSPRNLIFASYRHTDAVGHESGWDLSKDSPYMNTLRDVDRELGRILDAIDSDENLRDRVAIILTADHGGGAPYKSHTQKHMWVNYIIPFIAWTGSMERHEGTNAGTDEEGAQDSSPSLPARESGGGWDLYKLNTKTRLDPGLAQPPHDLPDDRLPPIRNADAANLALHLLGLPAIAGSTVNAKQDLVTLDDE